VQRTDASGIAFTGRLTAAEGGGRYIVVDQRNGGSPTNSDAPGVRTLVGQPRTDEDGPVAEAEQIAAEISSDEQPLGAPGRRFDRRSPFVIGLTAAAGVAVTYAGVRVLSAAAPTLVLIGVAFFLALGLEPAASGLVKRGLPRWAATAAVFLMVLGLIGAFVAAAIPPLSAQAGQLIDQAPHYISMTVSTCSSASPIRSTSPAGRCSRSWSAPERRFSAR